jgi:hypothetical protein
MYIAAICEDRGQSMIYAGLLRFIKLTAFLSILITLVSCGGGGGSTGSSTTPITPTPDETTNEAPGFVQDPMKLCDVVISAVELMNNRILAEPALLDELFRSNHFIIDVDLQYYFNLIRVNSPQLAAKGLFLIEVFDTP